MIIFSLYLVKQIQKQFSQFQQQEILEKAREIEIKVLQQMLTNTRNSILMRRDITSDVALIPKEDYLKVASMILKLDPTDRKDDEIQALSKLTDELQFFKNINSKKSNVRNKLHYKICSKMKYESSKKGQAIIEYGAKADKFFVLLKGSVIVYLTKSAEILQNEIQEEMSYQEERNIPALYLNNNKEGNQNRTNSIPSNQSLSPIGKISFFKSGSILNTTAAAGQNSPMSRHNTAVFSDSSQSPKRSLNKNQNDSPLNIRISVADSFEPKENNVQGVNNVSSSSNLEKGRNSIHKFESININVDDKNIQSKNQISNEITLNNESGSEQIENRERRSYQQRFQRAFKLIKQKGKSMERCEQNSQIENLSNKDNNQDDNTQTSQLSTTNYKISMFSKLSSSIQNQDSDETSPVNQKFTKQLSLIRGQINDEQIDLEDKSKQNENEELNKIRNRFCEKYIFSKIFGSLVAGDIEKPEKLIHFPSFVFKYYYQRTLEQGCTFGELGLLDGKPRSALILCAEDCEFGIMEKDDYQELLGNIHRREIERKFNFLKDHMLPELTNQALKKIFYNFQKIKVQKNEYIFKQGNLSDGIYLIKKGDIKGGVNRFKLIHLSLDIFLFKLINYKPCLNTTTTSPHFQIFFIQ